MIPREKFRPGLIDRWPKPTLAFSREFVERGSHARKSFADIFGLTASAYAEVLGGIEEATWNNAGFVFFMQELAKGVGVATRKMRKGNCPGLRPDGQEVWPGVQKFFHKRAIRAE